MKGLLAALAVLTVLAGCSAPAGSGTAAEQAAPLRPQTLVAHAGGAIYGYRLSNSLEALQRAYDNGFRMIELDVERTSDGEYVLIHDWEQMAQRLLAERRTLTHAQFQQADTFMGLTLMDLDRLLEWLAAHGDCYIVTDAKCGNRPFLQDLARRAGGLARQMIPQAYSYEEVQWARACGFERVILTLYQMPGEEEEAILSFARTARPFAVTIPQARVTASLLAGLEACGVAAYAHTVNDLSFYEMWAPLGLTGIYTDHFYPDKWPYGAEAAPPDEGKRAEQVLP